MFSLLEVVTGLSLSLTHTGIKDTYRLKSKLVLDLYQHRYPYVPLSHSVIFTSTDSALCSVCAHVALGGLSVHPTAWRFEWVLCARRNRSGAPGRRLAPPWDPSSPEYEARLSFSVYGGVFRFSLWMPHTFHMLLWVKYSEFNENFCLHLTAFILFPALSPCSGNHRCSGLSCCQTLVGKCCRAH